MLPQDRVPSTAGLEEHGPELAVEGDHEEGHGDDREGEEEKEGHHGRHPREDRHPQQPHPLGAHVEDRDYEIDRRDQGGEPEDLEAEGPIVHHGALRVEGSGVGLVPEPAAVGGVGEEVPGARPAVDRDVAGDPARSHRRQRSPDEEAEIEEEPTEDEDPP